MNNFKPKKEILDYIRSHKKKRSDANISKKVNLKNFYYVLVDKTPEIVVVKNKGH